MKKVMIDLFCGTKSMGNVFEKMGYHVITVDNCKALNPTICKDVMDINSCFFPERVDVIHASPPCTCFSVASIGCHWNKDRTPKTNECKDSIRLVEKTIELIESVNPKYFYIENPMGMMRKLDVMEVLTKKYYHNVVTYCQYGDTRMKKTDFWHNNPNWKPRPPCKNGDACHVAAPRGSRTGTQGMKNAVDRGVIPMDLCKEICLSSC